MRRISTLNILLTLTLLKLAIEKYYPKIHLLNQNY